jgi:hemerythrin-like domain-containing protein
MMNAIDVLQSEHRVIEQVLNCLEILAARCDSCAGFDKQSAREMLEFFGNFADKCHHGKEEGHLFPLLEARGFPRQGGPTGVMLQEHEVGRRLTAEMARSIEENSPQEFARQARAYVALMHEHILKEDRCLFPLAAQSLNAADAELLAQRFEHVEDAEMGQGMHEHFLKLANDLADRFAVSRAQPDSPHARACCHHSHN